MSFIIHRQHKNNVVRLFFQGTTLEVQKVEQLTGFKRCNSTTVAFPPDLFLVDKIRAEVKSCSLSEAVKDWIKAASALDVIMFNTKYTVEQGIGTKYNYISNGGLLLLGNPLERAIVENLPKGTVIIAPAHRRLVWKNACGGQLQKLTQLSDGYAVVSSSRFLSRFGLTLKSYVIDGIENDCMTTRELFDFLRTKKDAKVIFIARTGTLSGLTHRKVFKCLNVINPTRWSNCQAFVKLCEENQINYLTDIPNVINIGYKLAKCTEFEVRLQAEHRDIVKETIVNHGFLLDVVLNPGSFGYTNWLPANEAVQSIVMETVETGLPIRIYCPTMSYCRILYNMFKNYATTAVITAQSGKIVLPSYICIYNDVSLVSPNGVTIDLSFGKYEVPGTSVWKAVLDRRIKSE